VKILKVNPANLSSAIPEAIEIFRKGGVVAHPTDTVWGLACDAGNKSAIRKIHALKKSDPNKPLLWNLPSKSYLNKIGSKLCKAHKLAKEFWPGALSLLILTKDGKRKLGVRLPDHKLSNALARKFGASLTTTSANLSGRLVVKDAAEVAKIFPKIDLILDDGSSSKNNPSTLIDVSGKEVKLIREGRISFKTILRTLSSHS
jgi:L-threonylcarbamoyladenylate synthase